MTSSSNGFDADRPGRSKRLFLLGACALAAACSGEGTRGGAWDLAPDGSSADERDGGRDAALEFLTDGGVGSCSLADGQEFSADLARSSERSFAVTIQENQLHIAYTTASCTAPGNGALTGTVLKHHVLPSTGSFGAPTNLSESANAGCELKVSPALTLGKASLMAYFAAPHEGIMMAQGMSVLDASEPTPFPNHCEGASWLAATSVGGVPLAAWVSGGTDGAQALWSVQHDGSPMAQRIVAEDAGHKPLALSLEGLNESSALLSWASTGTSAGVFVLRLEADGSVSGEPQRATEEPGPAPSVDLAVSQSPTGEVAGALVYTTGHDGGQEVKFRGVSEGGELSPTELTIAPREADARDVSISAHGSGYAVAYRALSAGSPQTRTLQVAFLDANGKVHTYSDLTAVSAESGGIKLRQAADGRLFVTWVDAGETGPKLRAVRLRCD